MDQTWIASKTAQNLWAFFSSRTCLIIPCRVRGAFGSQSVPICELTASRSHRLIDRLVPILALHFELHFPPDPQTLMKKFLNLKPAFGQTEKSQLGTCFRLSTKIGSSSPDDGLHTVHDDDVKPGHARNGCPVRDLPPPRAFALCTCSTPASLTCVSSTLVLRAKHVRKT